MIMNDKLLNYPTPIIAINKSTGLLAEKNHCAEIMFNVLHVGSMFSRYSHDIDYTVEKLSYGTFCDKQCTYFTLFRDDVTLLFMSFATFGESLLPFDILDTYKQKLAEIEKSSVDKTKERKYVKAVNNNLLKANYFNTFSSLFEAKLQNKNIRIDEKTVGVERVCTAINTASKNFLENINITFDIDYSSGVITADIHEADLISLILNSLMFCTINASDEIKVTLTNDDNLTKLSFEFNSNSIPQSINESTNSLLNSSLALIIAFEIAKAYGIKFELTKDELKNTTRYALVYTLPSTESSEIVFSANDKTSKIVQKLMCCIFFDENI